MYLPTRNDVMNKISLTQLIQKVVIGLMGVTLLNVAQADMSGYTFINDKDDRTKNQLHDYSPDWNSTHIIAGKTSWMYEQDEISLSIYLPISINE